MKPRRTDLREMKTCHLMMQSCHLASREFSLKTQKCNRSVFIPQGKTPQIKNKVCFFKLTLCFDFRVGTHQRRTGNHPEEERG